MSSQTPWINEIRPEKIAKLKKGDERTWEEAFEQLDECGWPLCQGVPSEERAELISEATMQLINQLDKLDPSKALGPYFRTILRRRIYDFLRKVYRNPQLPENGGPAEAADPAGLSPADAIEKREAMEYWKNLLQKHLSPMEFAALWAKLVEEKSYQEIAETLKISCNSVGNYISLARRKMRKILKRYRKKNPNENQHDE